MVISRCGQALYSDHVGGTGIGSVIPAGIFTVFNPNFTIVHSAIRAGYVCKSSEIFVVDFNDAVHTCSNELLVVGRLSTKEEEARRQSEESAQHHGRNSERREGKERS